MTRFPDKHKNKILGFSISLFNRLPHNWQIKLTPFMAGYYKDQSGIVKRFYNEQEGWEEHLANTKLFIKELIRFVKNKDKVAVLGSGWWLDLPIDFLINEFKEVHLFDICHPKQIIHKSTKQKKVFLHTIDITGGYIFNAVQANSWTDFFDRTKKLEDRLNLEDYDFVISLNLMNQLDILLIDFLKKRFGHSSKTDCLREKLQQEHLEILPGNKSCLITDCEEISISSTGKQQTKKALIYTPLPKSKVQKQWKWDFDTHQTYNRQNNTQFNVKALFF